MSISDTLLEKAVVGLEDKPAISMSGCKEDLAYHRNVVHALNNARPLTPVQSERLVHHKAAIMRLEKLSTYWFGHKL